MTDRNKAGVPHGAFFTKERISSKELAGVMVETWNNLETRFGPEKANLALWLMGRSADFVGLPGGRAAMRERLHELEEAHDLHGRTATAESIDLLKAILKTRRGRRVEG
jgi:hypothetical protein